MAARRGPGALRVRVPRGRGARVRGNDVVGAQREPRRAPLLRAPGLCAGRCRENRYGADRQPAARRALPKTSRMRALLVACALLAAPVHAQDAYPSRPLRFILPFPPGGGTDILGRIIAERLSASLGQPVVTENRGGAGGNVGAEAAARSAPDGYTIVLVAPSLAISKSLYSKLNYDAVKDFAPVSLVATVPNVMVTHPSVPAATLAEFIRLAKTKPGEMNFGSGGSGTSNHLAGELFNIVAGVKLVHVPYKGVNLAMNDVLS